MLFILFCIREKLHYHEKGLTCFDIVRGQNLTVHDRCVCRISPNIHLFRPTVTCNNRRMNMYLFLTFKMKFKGRNSLFLLHEIHHAKQQKGANYQKLRIQRAEKIDM